jgi:hypothetical protein
MIRKFIPAAIHCRRDSLSVSQALPPTGGSPLPSAMIGFASFPGVIRAMSDK